MADAPTCSRCGEAKPLTGSEIVNGARVGLCADCDRARLLAVMVRKFESNSIDEAEASARAFAHMLRKAGHAVVSELADCIDRGAKYTQRDMAELHILSREDGIRQGLAQAQHTNGARSRTHEDDDDGNGDDDNVDWHAVAMECAKHPQRLRNARERKFVDEMVIFTSVGGWISPRRAKWLRDCYVRVKR